MIREHTAQTPPLVEALAFASFCVLLIGAGKLAFLPADLFFRLDPLALWVNMLAARRIVPALGVGAAITLAATLILGRVWCRLVPTGRSARLGAGAAKQTLRA